MEKLLQIFSNILQLDIKETDLDLSQNQVEEWDSLAQIQIVGEIEEEFGVTIPFEDIEKISKLSDFLKYINE